MPTVAALCAALNVQDRGGDALPVDALKSPATYRAALHRALISRAPGQYSRRWHSARLNVAAVTCRRYERRHNIPVTPCFRETPLTWQAIDKHIPDEPLPGQFLMDASGKRYPAQREIVGGLLRRGGRVSLMTQTTNYYGQPPVPATLPASATAPQATPQTAPQTAPRQWMPTAAGSPAPLPIMPPASTTQAAPASSPRRGSRPQPASEPRPQAASPTAQQAAGDALYHALKALNPARAITRKTAQSWTRTFGADAIHDGLKMLTEHRAAHRNIHSPAGFLLVWLQAQSRRQSRRQSAPEKRRPQATKSG